MSMTDRVPVIGDIYLAVLDPVRGSEQAGTRPVIVLSSALMNQYLKRVIVCPITSNLQEWTTKVALPSSMKTKGMVLTDQVRAIDKKERLLRYIESAPPDLVLLVRSYVGRLLELEVPLDAR